MKATGIVRRIDDLGRVVIPKELRRNFKIREGDPLEIFTKEDGTICFKKYHPYDDEHFRKAYQIAKAIIPCVFVFLDEHKERLFGGDVPQQPYVSVKSSDGDIVCYLACTNSEDFIKYGDDFVVATKVLSKYFEED